MIEMAITSERVDPAAADWPRAVRLLLDHRLYAVAVGPVSYTHLDVYKRQA